MADTEAARDEELGERGGVLVEKGAGRLTGADGHLGAASCSEVLEDHCQLAATRELQRETQDGMNIISMKN